ncbi:unnamed protein product [Closterium sp. NIES-54]
MYHARGVVHGMTAKLATIRFPTAQNPSRCNAPASADAKPAVRPNQRYMDGAHNPPLRVGAEPPAPPAPPAPLVPPTPPAPPVPPSPPCPMAPRIDNHPVLTLLLRSAFDEYLSEPDYYKGPNVDVPAPATAPRWGQPEDFMWDESVVGADDNVQDAEEDWRAEGNAGAEGGTEADTEAATEAGTAQDVFPEGAPGGDDDDGIEYWASWYRPMEIKLYERLLDWRRKGTAVSVSRLQEWSRDSMKILYPLEKWKGSQRWSNRFHIAEQCKKFWQFVCDKRRERGIETTWIINADQTPLWLEMPATTTVDQTGVRSVPIRSAGYQKERVTVMFACTADGMKLKPWVFFKRKTVPKGVFPPGQA